MGLFDYLRVAIPLPVNIPLDEGDWQTKDLDCSLATFDLDHVGELRLDGDIFAVTGEVRFYGSGTSGGWVEYVAWFKRGRLYDLVLVADGTDVDLAEPVDVPLPASVTARRP